MRVAGDDEVSDGQLVANVPELLLIEKVRRDRQLAPGVVPLVFDFAWGIERVRHHRLRPQLEGRRR